MAASVEFVIPVLNEESGLAETTATLHQFLSSNLPNRRWRILIADNGSTDSTLDIAKRLAEEYDGVGYLHLDQRGRGRALSEAWLASDADILAYMDVDLSTELGAISQMVDAVDGGGYDLAIGSRLTTGAQVIGRPLRREIISRVYNLLVRGMFLTSVRDHQCGFKAISRKAAHQLVPLVHDKGWFLDSELLILAGKNGYRLKEVPVKWTDDPDSRVRVVSTAWGDFKGLLRLRFGGLSRASRLLADRQREG